MDKADNSASLLSIGLFEIIGCVENLRGALDGWWASQRGLKLLDLSPIYAPRYPTGYPSPYPRGCTQVFLSSQVVPLLYTGVQALLDKLEVFLKFIIRIKHIHDL